MANLLIMTDHYGEKLTIIIMDNYDNNGYTKLTMMTHYTFISIHHGYFMDHSPQWTREFIRIIYGTSMENDG